MTMRILTSWCGRTGFIVLALLAAVASVPAQSTKLPSADEVKALQAKYRAERDKIVEAGIAKRFIPAIMSKAEELAKKSDAALASGRLAQASEAIRQARWQLPFQPTVLPDHVSRIIGNLRLRHSEKINAVAYSPDGSKLATASSDQTVKIWDLGNGHEVLTYTGHTGDVRCLAWSPDGKTIVSAGMENNIRIWDPATGKDVHTIAAAGKYVSALTLSRDGKHLFTAQYGLEGTPPNGLFVYETKTWMVVREVRDYTHKIDALAVHPEGNILATGDDSGTIRLWQYPAFVENATQPAYWTKPDPTGATYHLSFSPDGNTLVRVGLRSLKFYTTPQPGASLQVLDPRFTIDQPPTSLPQRAVFSKDGKTLFTGGFDGNIYLWDPATGQPVGAFKNAHAVKINGLAFNTHGSQLASCGNDFTVRLWDFEVVLQSRDFEGHDGPVWTAAFSPDGTRIVSASADKTVKVWQRETGQVLFNITDHNAPVTVAQFSPDGKLIASAGGDKLIRIFDADTGKPLRTCEGHQGTITFLDFSRDSKRIVSGGADRRIKIWDVDTGKVIVPIDDNSSIVAAVAFRPDGKQIAVANIDQTIRLYDADTGKMQHHWVAHGTAVSGVAYSPNGQYLASCGPDLTVMVWPLAMPGTNAIRLSGHLGPVSMVAFHNDNQHLVSCGADQLIKLWKLEGNVGKELQTFRGHKDWVTAVAFSKDGHHVISSSVDRKLKIWEITSREIPLLAEHTSKVDAVAVSPDGKIIASGSRDGTIKLWDRTTGVEIGTLKGHAGAVVSIVFTPDSKRLVSCGGVQEQSEIRFWEVAPPRELPRTPAQSTGFARLRLFSSYISLDPAGQTVFAWFVEGGRSMVEAFDFATGNPLFSYSDGNRAVNSLAFCTNGQLAATGAQDGSIRLWEMKKTSANIAPGGDWFLFDKIGVADLSLTPDGKILIASNNDGEIRIAKIAGREVLKTLKGHDGMVRVCLSSTDGKRFATAGADNVVKLWDTETGKELRQWDLGRQLKPLVVNLAFTPDGRHLVTANANTTVYVLDLP